MRIGILGCGAMGSIYAGYLSKAHDVYIVEKLKSQVEAIRKDGIRIEEDDETVVCHPAYITDDAAEVAPVELLIVFVKYMYLEEALKSAKPMISPDTIVLSLQNGLGNYDEIIKVIPKEQVCSGTTAHGSVFLEPGCVLHTGTGVTNIGTIEGNMENVEKAAAALKAAGFQVNILSDVMKLIWKKMFGNIAINGICALLGQKNCMVVENSFMKAAAEKLVLEAVAVANAMGQNFIGAEEVQNAFQLAVDTAENCCSMLQDVTNHRKTEIEIINGAVVKYGQELGIATPYNEMICRLIEAKQTLYA